MVPANDAARRRMLWESLAPLRPRLKNYLDCSRHRYRNEVNYVLYNTITGESYRFAGEIYNYFIRFTGELTVEQILHLAADPKQPEKAEEQQKIIVELLTFLVRIDAVTFEGDDIDIAGLFPERAPDVETGFAAQLKKSFLFFKIPLFNPARLVERLYPFARIFFTRGFLLLFVLLLFAAGVELSLSWKELLDSGVETLFTANNMLLLWCVYPLVKGVHEFAHALAVRWCGREVDEMGFMFLLLMPVPYVNASSVAGVSSKWQRIAVSSAGIIAELTLSCIALLLWARVESGLFSTVLFNVMLIGGVSTLLFNGNPLVRFDGYYVLADFLEIPNMAHRSRAYISAKLQCWLLGTGDGKADVPTGAGQKKYYIMYGIGAVLYRITIYGGIFWGLATFLGPFGVGLACAALLQMVVYPWVRIIGAGLRKCIGEEQKVSVKRRVYVIFTLLVAVFWCLPLPAEKVLDGVIRLPEKATLRVLSPGTARAVNLRPGDVVKKGQVVVVLENESLEKELHSLNSQKRELIIKQHIAYADGPLEEKIARERVAELSERIEFKKRQQEQLTLSAEVDGVFSPVDRKNAVDRFFKHGDVFGYIIQPSTRVTVVSSQDDVEEIWEKSRRIVVRFERDFSKDYPAVLADENPQATRNLPHAALGVTGGGTLLVDEKEREGQKLLEEIFVFDVILDHPPSFAAVGSKVSVKFYLGYEPVGFRFIRKLRQLFLSRLVS